MHKRCKIASNDVQKAHTRRVKKAFLNALLRAYMMQIQIFVFRNKMLKRKVF